jgi:HSP20 family protein
MVPLAVRRRGRWEDPTSLLRREIERFFGPWFGYGDPDEDESTGVYPVDIHEDDEILYVDAELPGFRREEIAVNLDQGTLTISAERKVEESKGAKRLSERRFTRVDRSFTLPRFVDESKVDARLEDGVLHLKLPKTSDSQKRTIQIN